MSDKCPKCDRLVSEVKAERVDIKSVAAPGKVVTFRGVSYACSHCHSILSVQADPLALNADLARTLMESMIKAVRT
jgi:DNA-directed RNA polymerase subunit RPC12/RpoP